MIRLLFLLLLLVPVTNYAFAEHIFDSNAYAQFLDISQLTSDKVTFDFDGKSYDVYYGYRGSLDAMGSDELFPTLSSMNINEERKSIEIIGTRVIPEFGGLTILVLGISIMGIIYLVRKNPLLKGLTRIN